MKKAQVKTKSSIQERKIQLLKTWETHYNAINDKERAFMDGAGMREPLPLMEAYWQLFDEYTKFVAEKVGDKGEWLSWYCWENDMGKKRMDAGYNNKLKPIKNLNDLLKMIDGVDRN